ncbi:MAG TPA: patatin-like phospholipase family protein [Rhodanobacteraceae bacterium]|nr:patatin-like phospholipase family protein [Rhodanobacteraceae bacterium]
MPDVDPRDPDDATARGGLAISLVLGAGGARGYAHIGVIEELLAQGFDIRSIAGSSMGALIGGIHAAGKLDVYRDWVRPLQRFDVLRMLDWTISGGGFIKGNRIIGALKDLIGEVDIEDLPIAYTAVAVDIDVQREVWFSRGPLFDAIRASIAIPTIFRPYRYHGRTLVDGGLLNPLPVSPTLRDRTDATIAVDVNAPAEPLDGDDGDADRSRRSAAMNHGTGGLSSPEIMSGDPAADAADRSESSGAGYRQKVAAFIESLHDKRTQRAAEHELGVFDLVTRSLDTVQETITRLKLAAQPPDLLITIPRNACAFYEFYRAEEVIEIGRRRTREALAHWHRPARRWSR